MSNRADVSASPPPSTLSCYVTTIVGLTRTADFYGIGVILLAISSLVVNFARKRSR
jgi:hypothetical protein